MYEVLRHAAPGARQEGPNRVTWPRDGVTLTLSAPGVARDEAFAAVSRPFPLDDAELAALRPDFDRLLASCNNRPPAVEIDARYICIVGRTAASRFT